MLIKTGSLGAAGKTPHRIVCKLAPDVYKIEHPATGCECQVLWSVAHAPWISYDMARGSLLCDHCKAAEDAPCPSRRDHLDKNIVFMEPQGIEGDLLRFQAAHESCAKPAAPQADKA